MSSLGESEETSGDAASRLVKEFERTVETRVDAKQKLADKTYGKQVELFDDAANKRIEAYAAKRDEIAATMKSDSFLADLNVAMQSQPATTAPSAEEVKARLERVFGTVTAPSLPESVVETAHARAVTDAAEAHARAVTDAEEAHARAVTEAEAAHARAVTTVQSMQAKWLVYEIAALVALSLALYVAVLIRYEV